MGELCRHEEQSEGKSSGRKIPEEWRGSGINAKVRVRGLI